MTRPSHVLSMPPIPLGAEFRDAILHKLTYSCGSRNPPGIYDWYLATVLASATAWSTAGWIGTAL